MARLFIFIFLALASPHLLAQETRSLLVNVGLDVGAVERDLSLQATVNNHSFVVISVFPFVAIRPITSQNSVLFQLPKGETEAIVAIEDILLDAVDYTVEFSCLNCADTVPRQFYRPSENSTALAGATFIDPEDLPLQISSNLITRAQISGQLSLLAEQTVDRELVFEVAVSDLTTGNVLQSQRVTLMAGENSANYRFRGIIRNALVDLELSARCISCFGISPISQRFNQVLSTQADSQAVDFIFDAEAAFPLNGVLDLILSDN